MFRCFLHRYHPRIGRGAVRYTTGSTQKPRNHDILIANSPTACFLGGIAFMQNEEHMKKILTLFVCVFVLDACEQTDTRTQAANIIYNQCVQSGENARWCRCLRADLIAYEEAFNQEIASYIVNGHQHPFINMAIAGARIRCECRMFPRNMEAHGLSCAGLKPIKY